MSEAAEIRAEIEAMPMEALQKIALSGVLEVHPLRVALDTPERRAAARELVADLERDHGAELWRERGSVTAEAVAERRLAALARAWARLGGGDDFLFHVYGERRADEDRRVVRTDREAATIAIHPDCGVKRAPYFEHPFSLPEAARFAVVLPVLRCCAELGSRSVAAFDVLGQPTVWRHEQAIRRSEAPRRRIVWRIRSAQASARSRVRMVLLTLQHVLGDLCEGGTPLAERLGVPRVAVHHGYYGPIEAVAIGVLAWRRARELDAQVRPSPFTVGNRMLPDPAVVGRRYRELDDPFTPLLAILRLGCRLHAFSDEATTLELQPLA